MHCRNAVYYIAHLDLRPNTVSHEKLSGNSRLMSFRSLHADDTQIYRALELVIGTNDNVGQVKICFVVSEIYLLAFEIVSLLKY